MTPAAGGPERLAAIDVGSNSIRLLVATWDATSGLEVIDELKDQPRLARGLAESGMLSPAAQERALATLRRMKEVAERRGAARIAAVATAAVREAKNGPAFVARVRREVRIPLEVISAEREAQLSWRSVAHHFQVEGIRTLVADIGGGSLEIVGAVDGLVELATSLPLGAVRLTEANLNPKRSLKDQIADLRRRVRDELKTALPRRDWVKARLIGSGGTFTNLARMIVARRGEVQEAIHGTVVSTAEVEALLEWLCTRTVEQRAQVPGLNPARADTIPAGLAVAAELLARLEGRQLTVSAFGLREGLLLEMAGVEGAGPSPDPLRLMREFVDRCRGDRRHVEQVRELALVLYDRLGDALGCSAEERRLLEAAALLHDVGQLVSYQKHHKHSYQLIMHAERLGLGARERLLVATISRYHRKSGPSRKHEEFARLGVEDQAIVRRLSGLLRVADGLDRGHTAAVDRLRIRLTEAECRIGAAPRLRSTDVSLEVWGAERKADVLEKALKRSVVLRAMQPPRKGARARKRVPKPPPPG
jgi:exopolyphosphatase/guanosine-5'-triphosphate,3'-diphosphate pyrophosphatase